ncbi:hypothetical protein ACL02T_03870 [Pseudonocardia sp. RS010]|uniref:hypothetical protein n=1 Tax=Pseudonocardia sp. RS010 TaxID=3385979 RepID=UPI00399EFC79
MSEQTGHERHPDRHPDETRGERLTDRLDPRTDGGTAHGDRTDDRSFLDKVLGRDPGHGGPEGPTGEGHGATGEGHGGAREERGGVDTRERHYDTGEGGGHRDLRRDEGVRTVDLRGGQEGATGVADPDTTRDPARDSGYDTAHESRRDTRRDTVRDTGQDTGHDVRTHGSGVPDERMPGDEGGSGLREARDRHDAPGDSHRDTRPGDSGRSRADAMAAPTTQETDSSGHATLIPQDRSADYLRRWESLKAGFVDEPRGAVRDANVLVGEVLDELEQLFQRQRSELERDLNNESASTEDLRLALGRYRSFFDRLLTI